MNETSQQSYVLGHGSEEHRRLILQSRFVGELTEAVFARAGLAKGMRVLDVGCGAGDVSLLAAAFVGACGSVLGIDQSPESISLARDRAKAAGLDNVRFEVARIEAFDSGERFDALVGRLVLLYLKEPAVVLRHLAERVRPGGIVVFHEMEMTTARCVPASPLFTQTGRWIVEAFTRAGVETSMGSRMYSIFEDAGLPAPDMISGGRVEGRPDSQIFEWLAQTVRSLLPMIEKTGVATADEVGIDTLADRLRTAVVEQRGVAHSPIFVGAWTRKQ
ncbi:MAG TPA: class I SAM-dependent methyltransferase [Rhodanobacteraceae bacterium]|nr:class I SAM-dependent methyltransferase [Rhodanobacteraceae bacterium]